MDDLTRYKQSFKEKICTNTFIGMMPKELRILLFEYYYWSTYDLRIEQYAQGLKVVITKKATKSKVILQFNVNFFIKSKGINISKFVEEVYKNKQATVQINYEDMILYTNNNFYLCHARGVIFNSWSNSQEFINTLLSVETILNKKL